MLYCGDHPQEYTRIKIVCKAGDHTVVPEAGDLPVGTALKGVQK